MLLNLKAMQNRNRLNRFNLGNDRRQTICSDGGHANEQVDFKQGKTVNLVDFIFKSHRMEI